MHGIDGGGRHVILEQLVLVYDEFEGANADFFSDMILPGMTRDPIWARSLANAAPDWRAN